MARKLPPSRAATSDTDRDGAPDAADDDDERQDRLPFPIVAIGASAGGIEAGVTALTLYHGVITPTINYTTPDPQLDLDFTPNTAREAKVDVALSNSMGFGGHNAVLVMRRYNG